jgi:hypothetical protein
MKKLASIFALSLLFFGFSSFKAVEFTEKNYSSNGCEVLIKSWRGTLFGQNVYFSSYSCALNAGATNIQPGGMQSQCIVFTCI